jgi:DNA-binding protein H-NS
MTSTKTEIAKLELQTFFNQYDALKESHQKKEITNEQFVKGMIKLTASMKPKRAKKAKEAPKYKRITVQQFEEYQQLKEAK